MSDVARQSISDTDWMTAAACAGYDPDLFFPSGGRIEEHSPALAVCRRCPVRNECLEFALDTFQDFGIWGGVTANERRRMRRQRRRNR